MPKRKKTHRKSSSQSSIGAFLRRPIVQIGIVLVAALVIFLIVAGAGAGAANQAALAAMDNQPSEITTAEAYSMYMDGAFVLDVREQSEWDEYHIPGTTLIPLNELASRVGEVPRDRPIVVVCRSGNRSQEGGAILLDAGFSQVVSLAGGLKGWAAAGYPTEP